MTANKAAVYRNQINSMQVKVIMLEVQNDLLRRMLSSRKGQITKLKKQLATAQTFGFGDNPDNHKLANGKK